MKSQNTPHQIADLLDILKKVEVSSKEVLIPAIPAQMNTDRRSPPHLKNPSQKTPALPQTYKPTIPPPIIIHPTTKILTQTTHQNWKPIDPPLPTLIPTIDLFNMINNQVQISTKPEPTKVLNSPNIWPTHSLKVEKSDCVQPTNPAVRSTTLPRTNTPKLHSNPTPTNLRPERGTWRRQKGNGDKQSGDKITLE